MAGKTYIVVANTESGGYRLICAHCGAHYDPALPCGLDMFSVICKQFEKDHTDCEPREGVPSVEEIRLLPSVQYGLAMTRLLSLTKNLAECEPREGVPSVEEIRLRPSVQYGLAMTRILSLTKNLAEKAS